MHRLLLLTFCLVYSCFTLAGSKFQVDLIVFAHPQNANKGSEDTLNSPFIPISKNAIRLKSDARGSARSYQLLPSSKSGLGDEYYQLKHKNNYQVLGRYSWIQTDANKSTVALPFLNANGWQMQGTVRVRQSNYYLVDADLQLSSPGNPQSSFTVSQKQRLKNNTLYYLDHPQVGMLVKIHKSA